MKEFLSLFLLLLLPTGLFAEEFQSGAVYVYYGNPIEQYTEKLKMGQTYVLNNPLSILPDTNQSILYFSNELIAKIDTNTTLNIVTFDQEILQLNQPPSKLKVGKHSLILNLVSGEVVLNSTKPIVDSSIIVSTPFGDVEINGSSTILLQVKDGSLLVFCYSGEVTVYSNRGNGDVISKNKQLVVTPNKFPMRGDNRKYILNKKTLSKEEQSPFNLLLPREDINIRGDVFFALINKKVVGINIH